MCVYDACTICVLNLVFRSVYMCFVYACVHTCMYINSGTDVRCDCCMETQLFEVALLVSGGCACQQGECIVWKHHTIHGRCCDQLNSVL